MQTRRNILISIIYYLLFAVAGIIGLLLDPGFPSDPGFFGEAMITELPGVAVIGILYLICYEVLDEYSTLCKILKVFKNILFIPVIFFAATGFWYYLVERMGGNIINRTFLEALVDAIAVFPLLFILFRGPLYTFTLNNYYEDGLFVITIIFPIICYVLSVIFVLINVFLCLCVIAVLWLIMHLFIKGRLNAFERILYNLAYYIVFFCIAAAIFDLRQGVGFDPNLRLFGTYSFCVYGCCFFFFMAMDIFRNLDIPRWVCYVIGFLSCGGLIIASFTSIDVKDVAALSPTLSCGFRDALKYALYFTPIICTCIRIPIYKLNMECDDFNYDLTDVFNSFLIPIISYVISVIFLLIGFIYPIIITVAVLVVAFIIMFIRNDYPSLPDPGYKWRKSVSGYIYNVKIIDKTQGKNKK